MKLQILVQGQTLRAHVPQVMVADTVNYFSADFIFKDEVWSSLTKYAHFQLGEECYDIPLENDMIPESAGLNLQAGSWSMYVHGDRYEDGELVQRVTTNACCFTVQESGCLDGSAFPSVPPDLAAELIARVENLESCSSAGAIYSSSLPVLYLEGDTSAMSKDTAAALTYRFGDLAGSCSVKWQGSNSLANPKKNYTVTFDQAFKAKDSWTSQNKYCAKANYTDATHAQNVVSAKLWGQIVKDRQIHLGWDNVNNMYDDTAYTYEDGVLISNKNNYDYGVCSIFGVTLTNTSGAGYEVTCEAYFPADATDLNVVSYIHEKSTGASKYIKVSVSEAGAWVPLTINTLWVDSDSWFSLQGARTNGVKFRNIKITNLYGDKEVYYVSPIKQLQALPNGGAIDGFPIIIMLNDVYQGVYTFNIPKDAWMFGMDAEGRKAILCADYHADATQFRASATFSEDFGIEYATDDSWVPDSLNRLINACVNSDGSDLDSTIAKYLDWDSAIDYYIFTSLIGGTDMVDKNYLLATFDGVKWFFSAYDMDSTYGLAWDGKSFDRASQAEPHISTYYHRVMELIRQYKSEQLKARFEELVSGVLSEDNVANEFYNFCAPLPKPLLDSDLQKWPGIPSSSVNTVDRIVDWYRLRLKQTKKLLEAME